MSNADLGFIHHFVPAKDSQLTLLLLHGTGGDENDLLDLGRSLAPSAALLSPRGKVLENGMPRFFRRLAEGVFDQPDLIARTHELAAFITRSAAVYRFDAHKVVAVGYSNGANIAASMLLLCPDVLTGAILFRVMLPLEPEHKPDLTGKPIFIGAGQHDPFMPRTSTERLAALLKEAGATVTLRWQMAAHGLTREEIPAAAVWLARTTLG